MDSFNDMMGGIVKEGDYVATVYDDYDHLYIAQVTGFTPKFVKLHLLNVPYDWNDKDKRREPESKRFIKVSEEQVTMYMLKYQNKD